MSVVFKDIEQIVFSESLIPKIGLSKNELLNLMMSRDTDILKFFIDVTELHSLFTGRGNRAQVITVNKKDLTA